MKNHPYKKKWGQNFIQDENTIKKIINTINPKKNDKIIEIGPGEGALTKHLLNSKKLITIEIDPLLCSYLNSNWGHKIQIINEDFLNLDISNYQFNKIIGNLPYYITTPIIFKVLKHPFWDEAVFMTQKEVAERITATPGNKIYGRLSVMVQVLADVEKIFNIPRNIFYPKPKVDSSLIKLTIKKKCLIQNFNLFSEIVKKAFGQRRKILKNSLKDTIPIDAYLKYANKRPEQLSVDNYIEITNNI